MTSIETASITAEEARVLTDAIKSALVATWNLREQAYKSRVWIPLGYSSWETYCEAEFSTVAIPRAERTAVVAAMRGAGMSTRAIAAATGLGVGTVHRELAGVPSGTPETVVGADGKRYSAQRPEKSATPNVDDLIDMVSPLVAVADWDSPALTALPDAFDELTEAVMRRLGHPYPNPVLDGLIEEKRAEPLNKERCKALASMSDTDFEEMVAEFFSTPPDDFSEVDAIRLRLLGLGTRMDRRVGQLLLEDEEENR